MSQEKLLVEEIALRLRELRESVGLTRAGLAARAGALEEDVRAFESGGTEIPVSYLFKVARACGVDATALMSGGDAHLRSYSLVRAGDGLSVERREDYYYLSLASRFTGRVMEPFLITAPAKTEAELRFHEHDGQEFIYVLEGRLELRLADDVLVLEPHDAIYFNSRIAHAMRGLDDTSATFLDVIV